MESGDKLLGIVFVCAVTLAIVLVLAFHNYYQTQLAVMVKHCESTGMVISHDRQSGVYTCANKADVGKVEKEKP
jgi:hypothetical protein